MSDKAKDIVISHNTCYGEGSIAWRAGNDITIENNRVVHSIDARLQSYGITECDCPSPFASDRPASEYVRERFGLDDEDRTPCGCGQETIYLFRLGDTLHFENKHWWIHCLLAELAGRLKG